MQLKVASDMQANLPLELWRIIMRHAVHIRGALETVMTTQFEWNEWRYNEDRIYERSIGRRRTLVQVCKAWYWPAMEILYEDIRLRWPRNMESLRTCLGESSQSGSHLARGWWTKRLDLPPLEDIDDPLLEPLIAHFPNLRILRFYSVDSIREVKILIPKLRSTDLEPNDFSSIPQDLDSLLLIATTNCNVTFHNLTSLDVVLKYGDMSMLQNYSFPNLRHLILSNAIEPDIPPLETFLDKYGQQLLSLRMDFPKACSASGLERILRRTPNIRELIALPHGWAPTSENTFPSVTHIGIACNLLQVNALCNPFFNTTRFPKLKCIRMVDEYFQPLDPPAIEFTDWYHNRRLAGIRYEDAYGVEVTDMIDEILWDPIEDFVDFDAPES